MAQGVKTLPDLVDLSFYWWKERTNCLQVVH